MTIALDATYSIGENLSGIGVYSQEIIRGLAGAHSRQRFTLCYRPHRFPRSFGAGLPRNCRRALLLDWPPVSAGLFHGLNQRLPRARYRRTVCTFHDLFVLTGDYSTPEFRRRFAEQARDAARGCDAIIAVSRFTANQVMDLLGVEASRVHVVHHGVRALPPVKAARENIVLHVGAIQRRKNIEALVRAFETLPKDWRLVLAGSAGFGAAGILAGLAGNDRIVVTGYVDADNLAGWYAKARIFAFPSLDEGFGMPVLEAMSAGVPVLASNRSALPEVCGDAALLVDASDDAALAASLQRLAADTSLRDELHRRGVERAAQFTWEKAVAETWRVYEALA